MSRNSEHNVKIVWDAPSEGVVYPKRDFKSIQQRVRRRKIRIRVLIGATLLIVLLGIFATFNLMKRPASALELPNASGSVNPHLSMEEPFDWSVIDTITTRKPVSKKQEVIVASKVEQTPADEVSNNTEVAVSQNQEQNEAISTISDATHADKSVIEKPTAKDTTVNTPNKSFVPSEFFRAYPSVGYDSLYRYLTEYINKELLGSKNQSDTLRISFAIETDGHPTGIKLSIETSDSVFMKIEEVVQNMPAWQPATADGVPIKTRFRLPLIIQSKTIKVQE